jgi:hypothetical protein
LKKSLISVADAVRTIFLPNTADANLFFLSNRHND